MLQENETNKLNFQGNLLKGKIAIVLWLKIDVKSVE